MTEAEAVARYKQRIRSAVMQGAFRKGYRAGERGASVANNPYRQHRSGTGWGRRAYDAWLDGWLKANPDAL